jgi:Putative zinc-finger
MVINCEHVWREISNYLDDEVDAVTRAAMEAHFRECKHCTAVLDGTRNIVELYGDDRVFELPVGFSGRLQRRLARSAVSGFGSARTFWMLAVAATALMVGSFSLANSSVFRHPEVRSKLAQPAHNIPPALMVAVSTDGRLFHVPGCRYLHKHEGESPELMTAANAMKEGYAPCSRCLRQYLSATVECPRVTPGLQFAQSPREPWGPFPGL